MPEPVLQPKITKMHTKFLATLAFTALLGLAGLTATPSARAVGLEPSSVVPGDTFSFEIIGYNTNYPSQDVYLTQSALTPAFGTTTTYANGALGGQTLTISSFEYVNAGIVNDLINISVPNNFVPAGTIDNGGHNLDAIQFGIGNFFASNPNTLDFNQALTSYTVQGSVSFKYIGANASGVAPMTTTLTNGNKSLTTFGAVFATPQGTGDISSNEVNAFTILITYAVPEPSTYATVALGVAGLFLVMRRHRARL